MRNRGGILIVREGRERAGCLPAAPGSERTHLRLLGLLLLLRAGRLEALQSSHYISAVDLADLEVAVPAIGALCSGKSGRGDAPIGLAAGARGT
jgi:hypothetical protein